MLPQLIIYFRLPLISETFDRIASQKPTCFTSLDLRSGFTQLPIEESSQHKTAFTNLATGTQYMFTRTLQGLKNAPCSFHRVMVRVFKKILAKKCCEVYLDDILLYNKSHADHLITLEESLSAIQDSGMLINLEKCEFGVSKLTYLGFEMDKTGYRPDPRKMKSILEMKMPETLRSLRGLLGFVGFYRMLIPKFSQLVKPLTYLTTKAAKYTGGPLPDDAVNVFKKLQEIFTSRPFLAFPDFSLDFHVYVDASLGSLDDPKSGGLAGCLVQYENNDTSNPPKPIGFCSRSLSNYERNYTVSMVETLGVVFSIEYFEKYLRRKFYVHSDHRSLSVCKSYHKRTIARFKEILANYDFDIIYEKGETMVSDYPSRHVGNSQTNKEISIISSKQLHKKIESFENEKVQLHKTRSEIKNEKVESFEQENLQLQNTRSAKFADRQDLYSSTDSNKKKSYQNFSDAHAVHALCKQPIGERGQGCQNALEKEGCVQTVDERAGHATCTDLEQAQDAVSEVQSPLSSTSAKIAIDSSASKNPAGTPINEIKKELGRPAQVAALKSIGDFDLSLKYEPDLDRKLLIGQQSSDPFIQQLKMFILHKILPKARYRNIVKRYGPNAFIKNGVVMIRLEREGYQTKDVFVLPACRHAEFIATNHCGKIGGHSKVEKTTERLLEFC